MSDAVLSQFKQATTEEKVYDTNHKFKIAIIGTGWIAESHIQSYKNQPDVEIVAAADLIPGMVVFKAREPGEEKCDLPDKYKNSGDLRDYYHVGVVTQINPLRITHCTSVPGGIKVDDKLGAWHYAGYLKQVDYQEAPMEALYQAEVFAKNGQPVRLRSNPSTSAKVIEQIPVGAVVDVLEETSDAWAKISDAGVIGYMMRKFLMMADNEGGALLTHADLKEIQACLSNALRIINRALGE